MMFIEPGSRVTLSELLRGKGRGGGLQCICGGVECGGGLNGEDESHDHGEVVEEDEGDEWLRSIETCSILQGRTPTHEHLKVVVEEKQGRRRFFHH